MVTTNKKTLFASFLGAMVSSVVSFTYKPDHFEQERGVKRQSNIKQPRNDLLDLLCDVSGVMLH